MLLIKADKRQKILIIQNKQTNINIHSHTLSKIPMSNVIIDYSIQAKWQCLIYKLHITKGW